MIKKKENIEKKNQGEKTQVKKVSSFSKKKKVKKNIVSGIAYVYSTFNNTIISIADESGNVVSWSSAGSKGFRSKNYQKDLGFRRLKDFKAKRIKRI